MLDASTLLLAMAGKTSLRRRHRCVHVILLALPCLAFSFAFGACSDQVKAPPSLGPCEGTPLSSRPVLACEADFLAQAARPLDASLPGARTIKTIIDRGHDNVVYYLDTKAYPLHVTFAREKLGYPTAVPFVSEYVSADRAFLLGSVTHYEAPDVWAYELAPYDTGTVDMIATAMRRLASTAYFGAMLRFHPTSEAQSARAAQLPAGVRVVSTEEITAGLDYQPLNLGETVGQVRLVAAAELATTYVSPRELVVLDHVPNDLTAVAGGVTADFQTPLSHVNVLSQQRGTPNMALRDAQSAFSAKSGKWVKLTVGAFAWSAVEVTPADAEAWWQAHRPAVAVVPTPDFSRTDLLDVDAVGVADISTVGGKAANYGELRKIGGPVRVRPGLVVPVARYAEFMETNGFATEVAGLLGNSTFQGDGNERRRALADLQTRMRLAPVNADFLASLEARLNATFPKMRMKFRSSTNAEDLEHHTGAGLYDSKAGQPGDPARTVADALRTVWASTWNFRAFEERAYAGIDHTRVAMGVLVVPSYQDEAANGVAITANLYDPGPEGEDAFYVNAQVGETSVVEPDSGVVADQLLYYFFHNGSPATYLAHSSLIAPGSTVLSRTELFELGQALAAVREHFMSIYTPPASFGSLPMDVEWKLDATNGERHVWLKQARPYPGRGTTTETTP